MADIIHRNSALCLWITILLRKALTVWHTSCWGRYVNFFLRRSVLISLLWRIPTISSACANLTKYSPAEAARHHDDNSDPSLILPCEAAAYAICSTDWFSWRVSLSQFKGPSVLERQCVLNAIWTFLLRLHSWQQGGRVHSLAQIVCSHSFIFIDWFYEVERKQQSKRSAKAAEFDKWPWKCHPCRGGGSHRWLNNFRLFSCLSSRCLSFYDLTPSPILIWIELPLLSLYPFGVWGICVWYDDNKLLIQSEHVHITSWKKRLFFCSLWKVSACLNVPDGKTLGGKWTITRMF